MKISECINKIDIISGRCYNLSKVTRTIRTSIASKKIMYKQDRYHLRVSNNISHLKGTVNPCLHTSPTPRTSCLLRLDDNIGYHNRIQNRPHNWHGPTKALNSKAKLASQVSTA
jgi:hypothetical protein